MLLLVPLLSNMSLRFSPLPRMDPRFESRFGACFDPCERERSRPNWIRAVRCAEKHCETTQQRVSSNFIKITSILGFLRTRFGVPDCTVCIVCTGEGEFGVWVVHLLLCSQFGKQSIYSLLDRSLITGQRGQLIDFSGSGPLVMSESIKKGMKILRLKNLIPSHDVA